MTATDTDKIRNASAGAGQGYILRTEELCRNFTMGREVVRAVDHVSIAILERRLTILRGRSGSGKTTLMNLIGTLDRPDEGLIYFGDSEISNASESERDEIRRGNMGFVFQSIALISLMSAYENVDFRMRVAGFNQREIQPRVEECLTIVGLGKRMHHRPHELSGGEQQRVAIARAIAHRPKIIFADEPTAELDTHTGLQVVKLFRKLVEEENLTVLMTTHDPSMMEVADHVFTMEDGKIVDEQ